MCYFPFIEQSLLSTDIEILEFGGLDNLPGDDFSNLIYLHEIFIILFFNK